VWGLDGHSKAGRPKKEAIVEHQQVSLPRLETQCKISRASTFQARHLLSEAPELE